MIKSVTRTVDEVSYQQTLNVNIDIPLELIVDANNGVSDEFYKNFGQEFFKNLKSVMINTNFVI